MGIGDLYGQPPPPDPNAPVVAWGSPQAQAAMAKAKANYDEYGLKPFDALQQKLDADKAARAGAVQFANGQTGGAGAPGGPPAAPLQLPGAGYGAQVVKAHDVQLASDAGMEAKKRAQDEAKNAIDTVSRAKYEENEANAQAMAGYQGQLRGGQMEQQKADEETKAKTQAGYDEWKKAQDIDPDHYLNNVSKGKRVMLSIAAALAGAGQGLLHQGGKNPILEQIENETNRDIEAQKSKRDKAMSLYTHLREQGLDEQKAHALTFQHNAELAKAGLDAAVVGNASPTRLAEADAHKAAIDDTAADYVNKAMGRAQATVAGGSKGWTDAMAKEAQAMVNEDHAKGGSMSVENAMTRVARSHNLPFQGGSVDADKVPGAGGAGRQAGVQLDYQTRLSNINLVKTALQQARERLDRGYSPTDTTHEQIRSTLAAEYAKMLKGGASASAEEAHDARENIVPDLNVVAKDRRRAQLDLMEKNILEREADLKKMGPQIAGGQGFNAPTKEDETAASLGAVER